MKEIKHTDGLEEPTSQDVHTLLEHWRAHKEAEYAAAHKAGLVKLFGEEIGGREQQVRQACDQLAKDTEAQRIAQRADVLARLCQPDLTKKERASLIATLAELGLTKDAIIEDLCDLMSTAVGEQYAPEE